MARVARKETVLHEAARLFAEKGFAATSVREVADAAGLTKAGLYYHVREKEELLHAICAHSIAAILDDARPLVAEASGGEAGIRAVIAAHLGFFFRHPHNLVVLNKEMGHLAPAHRAEIAELERDYLDLIRGVIRAGREGGRFRRCDPSVSAFLLLSMLNGLDAWYRPERGVGPEALEAHIAETFLQGTLMPAGNMSDS